MVGEPKRLFVAVWPPVEVLDALDALARPDEPGVRYTTRAQWHVTLRFLGACAPDDAIAAIQKLRWPGDAVEARCGSAVSRLGRSSAIVVPVHGVDQLATAARSVTAKVGEPDERHFNGHLTIARVKGQGACRVAGAPFEARFPVTSVALVASDRLPDGASYTTIATFGPEGVCEAT